MLTKMIFLTYILVLCHLCTSSELECDYYLSGKDFLQGTYRIQKSGLYCLTEDIIFAPRSRSRLDTLNSPNAAGLYFPTDANKYPGSAEQKDGSFALGFFTAISIERSNVEINLNGYKIEYSPDFYIQQRFGSLIEIATQPFLPGVGPTDFGDYWMNLENIKIHNGKLGLVSHHSIHSNNASNVIIENLEISSFEVAGVQLNGFNNVELKDLDIGPSSIYTPTTVYYSNARFILLALRKLLAAIDRNNLDLPTISFSSNHYLSEVQRTFTLAEIEENLVNAMDYTFYQYMNMSDEQCGDETCKALTKKQEIIKSKGLDLFYTKHGLPDGGSMYGIVLNSHSAATRGFGRSTNGMFSGENIILSNINIHDLSLNVREIPAMYFDRCHDIDSDIQSILRGPFSDIMSIHQMVGPDKEIKDDMVYVGNPLSDTQIALYLNKDYINDGKNYAFDSFIDNNYLNWALNDYSWPANCGNFVCNGDIQFHTNKGVMGIRMDQIENTRINNININNLINKSPLILSPCANYSGSHDGGIQGTREKEGTMSTDIRGIAITNGDTLISGNNNVIKNLYSHYGDTTAINLMEDAILDFDDDDDTKFKIKNLNAATKVDQDLYQHLLSINKTPYPNNFNLCKIKIEDDAKMNNSPKKITNKSDCHRSITNDKRS